MLVLNMHNDIGQNGHAQHMGECWVATLILGVERGIPGLWISVTLAIPSCSHHNKAQFSGWVRLDRNNAITKLDLKKVWYDVSID